MRTWEVFAAMGANFGVDELADLPQDDEEPARVDIWQHCVDLVDEAAKARFTRSCRRLDT